MLKVAFIVNGTAGSAMAQRALAFADRLGAGYQVRIFYRSGCKALAILQLLSGLLRFRPDVCYVFDMGYAGVISASLFKFLTRGRVIVETGDAIGELARALDRGPVGVLLTRGLEEYALKIADRIVVRGSYHKEWFARRGLGSDVIQDAVATEQFDPASPEHGGTYLQSVHLRRQLGLEGVLTIGLLGSSVWSAKRGTCYGWDLIEVLRLLKDHPVAGVMIGGGSGIAVLRERCRRYGIEERVRFMGHVPYEQLPGYLNMIDVCLSTQSNDLVGQVRTTGKLPLYLASGRYVLASRVGEAALVLADDMLVDYNGTVDPDYPRKLAERILPLLADRDLLERSRARHVELARRRFDYDVLATRMRAVIDGVCACSAATGRSASVKPQAAAGM
jgi:glycosyltransferase involved in cell wall biosynthesis